MIALLLALLVALAALLAAGEFLSAPAPLRIGDPPEDLPAKTVRIATAEGYVAGWIAPGKPGAGAVLLLHGVRANRLEMLARARFLSALGYTVLLIDLPAHGESTGRHITFGAREAEGVTVALDFLAHQFPGERIGVVGVSLGAAALVLAMPRPAPDAVVLESMFPTIEEAVANRLKIYLGAPGAWLAPLLVRQLPLRFGVAPAQLRPIDAAAALHCPTLVISGTRDRRTPADETLRILEALPGPKELWLVDGAAHEDVYGFAPTAYQARLANFLGAHLRRPAPAGAGR